MQGASQPRVTSALVDGPRNLFDDDLSACCPRWYAAYTKANHEQRVADRLGERGIENYLPQYESVHKWKDRKVRLQSPLFPGYIFVHMALQNRLRLLQVPGVARLVSFAGRPVTVSSEEIDRIRALLRMSQRIKPYPYLEIGKWVRVRSGPFEGLEGIVAKLKNSTHIVVTIESIRRAIAVQVEVAELEVLPAGGFV